MVVLALSSVLLGCVTTTPVDDPGADAGGGAHHDVLAPTLVVGCDRFTIGEDEGRLVAAYGVAASELAEPCLGARDAVVEEAWAELVSVAPTELTEAVALVAGFVPEASETLAYAAPINDDSEAFMIALDVEFAAADPDERRLTMAHELAHVFTQTTDQLDVAVYGDECDTFFNGFGCLRVGSYLTDWIDTFWSPSALAALPVGGEIDEVAGSERCATDPTFPGSYAASHPEEDFAESFAAFVFDVDLPRAVRPRLEFFEAFPEFVEMQTAVAAAGWEAPENNFEVCG